MWKKKPQLYYYACITRAAILLVLLSGLGITSAAQEKANKPASASQEKRNIKGIVTDSNNKPLSGVTVTLTGTTVGVVTNDAGEYTIQVPADVPVELEFTIIDYFKKRKTIAPGISDGNISLQEDPKSLGDVVVIGYSKRKKETLTGAIATVDSKAFTDKGALASPLQALQGQVPGVIITRSSGSPGDESWAVKLRGAVSANGTEPLVIIDGVAADSYRDLRLINPDDIENISFLKDAAAAIYGSRAAGGVMLVTTKRARAGKTAVEYGGLYSRKIVGSQPRLMNLEEWANGVIDARTNDGYGADDVWIRYANVALANKGGYIDLTTSASPISNAFLDVKDFVFLDNNWTDILWGDGSATQHNLSIAGKNDKNSYRLSLGYLNDGGILRWGNNSNDRYNLRLVNTFQLSKRASLESVIAYNRQAQVTPTMLSNVLSAGYPQPGLPSATLTGKPYAWGGQYTPNWFAELGGDNKLKVSLINIAESFKFNITNSLKFVANLGYNSSFADRTIQQNAIQWYNYTGSLLVQNNPAQASSYFQKTTATTNFYSGNVLLQYNRTFFSDHSVDATVGTQYERNEYDYALTKVTDIYSSLQVLNGSGTTTTGKEKTHYAIGSYFGTLNYTFRSKFLFDANVRYDGSSKFLPVNRWNLFYGFSAAWRIKKENFMKTLDVVSDLKLRASYGIVGNQNGIDLYDGQQLYSMNNGTGAYLGSARVTTVTPSSTMVSYNRTWEKIQNYNIGLDFGLFNNRLTGSLEWFRKENNNMLISQSYSGVIGATAPKANIGKLKGSGWEGTINWNDHLGEVNYHAGGVITFAKNNLVNFGGANVVAQGYNAAVQGAPLNAIYGLKYAGRIQTAAQRQAYYDKYVVGNTIGLTNAIRLGDNMFADVNKDGKLTSDDLIYLGTDDPQLTFSFNMGVEWKGFDLSAIFQGATQRTIFRDDVNWRIPFRSVYLNTTNQSVNNHWTTENAGAYFPKYSTNSTINNYNYQASSWSVEYGDYLRLKNIVLGYVLPSSLVTKQKVISRLRVYVSGTDLWEYTEIHDGWDPESTRSVSSGNQRYPFSRTVTFGVNATF